VKQQFTIRGRLPGRNEVTSADRGNRYAANKLKRETQEAIAWAAKAARIKPVTRPVTVTCAWYERDRRRDVDNVQSGVKLILDALQAAGILAGDGQKHVTHVQHEPIQVDRANPRVVVTLEEDQ
jgi:Holliday junction resolvase RusA-like endonuclease